MVSAPYLDANGKIQTIRRIFSNFRNNILLYENSHVVATKFCVMFNLVAPALPVPLVGEEI